MLQAWIDMFWPLRYDTVSPRGLRELVIMRVAQLTDAVYEWSHHWPMAVGNGVRADQLRQLGDWESSDLFSDVERVALRYADGIIKMNVDDATFDAVRQTFSPAAIIELTLTASLYTNLARLTQALDVDLEPKYEEFARELGKA